MNSLRTIKQSVLNQIIQHTTTLAAEGFPAIVTLTAPDGKSFYMNFLFPLAPTPGYNQLPDSCYELSSPS